MMKNENFVEPNDTAPSEVSFEDKKKDFVEKLKESVNKSMAEHNNTDSDQDSIVEESPSAEDKLRSMVKDIGREESENEETEKPEESEEAEEKTKRKRTNYKDRINKVIKEKRELEKALERERLEKERLQLAYIEKNENDLNEKERLYEASYKNYIENLDGQYKIVKERLKEAELEGDIDAKIEAQEILAEIRTHKEKAREDYEAAIELINTSQTYIEPYNANNYGYPYSGDDSDDDSALAEEYRNYGLEDLLDDGGPNQEDPNMQAWNNFVQGNPWYNPNSELYNPQLAEVMNQSSQELLNFIQLEGLTGQISVDEWLDRSLKLTKDKLGITYDEDDGEEEEYASSNAYNQRQQAPARKPVQAPPPKSIKKAQSFSPVSPGNDYADSISAETPSRVRLTHEEAEFARKMADQKGMPHEHALKFFLNRKIERMSRR
jgi:hypothetical protein